MAAALARSTRLHNPDLPLAVITDHPDDPQLIDNFDLLVPFDESFGAGVEQKLSLDRYSPFDHTLFIDADCLVVRDLDPVFRLMGIEPFGCVGFPVVDGYYWSEVEDLMEHFSVPYIGRFNAGLMLFAGDDGRAVFETARRLVKEFGVDGLPTYRGAPHDEVPLSAALGHLGIVPIYDDGKVMRAPEPLESRLTVDVLAGTGRFRTKNIWVEPAVVHFAYLYHGKGLRGSIYQREMKRALGEPTSLSDGLRCAAAQAVFTIESSRSIRQAWKRSRGSIRRAAGKVVPGRRSSTASKGGNGDSDSTHTDDEVVEAGAQSTQ